MMEYDFYDSFSALKGKKGKLKGKKEKNKGKKRKLKGMKGKLKGNKDRIKGQVSRGFHGRRCFTREACPGAVEEIINVRRGW